MTPAGCTCGFGGLHDDINPRCALFIPVSEYENQIRMADDHHELQRLRKLEALIPEVIEMAEQERDWIVMCQPGRPTPFLDAIIAKLREVSQ